MCVLRARVYTAPESRDSIVASSSWCSSIRSANLHNTTTARKLGSHSLPLNISLHPNISKQTLHTILFLRCWHGELVWQLRASSVSDHSLYSHDSHVWFGGDIVRRNYMLVTFSLGTRQSHNVVRKSVSNHRRQNDLQPAL